MTPLDDRLLGAFLGSEAKLQVRGRSVGPKAVDGASESRLVHVLLAHSAAAIETTWTKEAWRSVDTRKAAWLTFLASQGYRLAEVERLVVDEAAADATKRARLLSVVPPADGEHDADDDGGEEEPDGDERGPDAS